MSGPSDAPGSRRLAPSRVAARLGSWLGTTQGFRLVLGVAFIAIGAGLTVPIAVLLRHGQLLGGDWAEYLYTADIYAGHTPLGALAYPFPALPALYLPLLFGRTVGPVEASQVANLATPFLVVGFAYAGYFLCRAHSRSRWAGLLGALAIAGFPLVEYEIAWGGQAQLLAYLLGALALWVLIDRALPARSWRAALVCGVILSIAAASELYAASFLIVTVWILTIAAAGRILASRRGLAMWGAAIVPPTLTAAGLASINSALGHPTGIPALGSLIGYRHLEVSLWLTLTSSDSLVGASYLVIVLLYLAFRLTTHPSNASQRWTVPAMVLAWLVIGLGITPASDADRALYPLVFPFSLVISELGASWPAGSGRSCPAPRWNLRPRDLEWALPVLVVASLAATGVQFGTDMQAYPNALAGYEFSHGLVSELTWLRGQDGAAIYDGAPVSRLFQVEWATERPLYPGPTFQPYLLTSAPKEATAVQGTELSYGQAWISDGEFTLTDPGGSWGQPSPGLLMFRSGFLYMTIESDDFENSIRYSTNASPGATYTTDMHHGATSIDETVTTGAIFDNYTLAGLSVERVLSASRDGTFYWNYTIRCASVVPDNASIFITSPGLVPTRASTISRSNHSSTERLTQTYAAGWQRHLTVEYTIGANSTAAGLSTAYIPAGQYGIFQLEYALTPSSPAVRTFQLSLAVHPHGASHDPPVVHSEREVLTADQIRWVVLDRSSSPIILQRFMNDPVYSLFRTSTHYFVLQVG